MTDAPPCEAAHLTLVQATKTMQPLTPARALALMRAMALALDRFHARQPVHGALSPQAFTVHEDVQAILEPPADGALAAASVRAYWSPQRRAGLPPRASDDLYALGVISAHLLASDNLAAHADDALVAAQITVAEDFVRALTSWSPAERPASGAEVVRALDRAAPLPQTAIAAGREDAPTAPHLAVEAPGAAAERVTQARRAHQLATTTPPRPARPVRPAQVRAPLGKGHYPDMPLPLAWVAAIVVVLCSVYLLPLYFMLFPSG